MSTRMCRLRPLIFPLAAGPQHVEDPVQNLAHVHRPSAPAVPAWRDHGRYDRPFGIS